MKKFISFILLFTILFTLSACSNAININVIADTETVYITRQDDITTIIDKTANKEYCYKTVRKRKTDIVNTDRNVVDTDTIAISIGEHAVIAVYDKVSEEEYRIVPKGSKIVFFLDELQGV